ncbi:hypothetical protein [Leifsonia virtsii]|uniref:Uncharacterized protein n=1 Tax=Leifsonia virtsii TaxID=3035915 RepID=A0ABT8IXP2_9MICO|nr:hypothetical protein [Leifsonia virtsii]MDN4597591.1 hypothetical protein [Leifsonia virtsii]
MAEIFDRALQALAVLVPIFALIQARRMPGRKYADRARTSLELATALEAAGATAVPALRPATAQATPARLRDDARFNAARYLQSGAPLGLRAPLIGMATFYVIAFAWMGVSDVIAPSSRVELWAGTILLWLSVAALIVALVALYRRHLDHTARHGAGLPVVTTVSELRDAVKIIRNRIALIRHRRRTGGSRHPAPSRAATIQQTDRSADHRAAPRRPLAASIVEPHTS